MKEFVIRGKTASGQTHTINFGGHKGDYGFRLVEFSIFPSASIPSAVFEAVGSVTAGKTAVAPTDPNFNDEGLIATTQFSMHASNYYGSGLTVVNDTFIITQDIILMVHEQESGNPVNWQCKFMPVKLSTTEAALSNYRQFSIYDD